MSVSHPCSAVVHRSLTSPLGDLQVASGQVLLHVLLEGLLKELLPVLQLHLLLLRMLRMLRLRDLLSMLGVQLRWGDQ